jgi:hypothetical protein
MLRMSAWSRATQYVLCHDGVPHLYTKGSSHFRVDDMCTNQAKSMLGMREWSSTSHVIVALISPFENFLLYSIVVRNQCIDHVKEKITAKTNRAPLTHA